jgi:hypothetical protein
LYPEFSLNSTNYNLLYVKEKPVMKCGERQTGMTEEKFNLNR